MKIVAVVLNYQRAQATVECVQSLNADAPEVPVVVVDNGSGDGSAEHITATLPDVRIVRSATNLGYSGGNNLGIAEALHAGVESILILNNDLIVEAGCVAALRAALESNPGWGIASPLSLLPGSGDIVDFFCGRVLLEHAALEVPGRDEPRGSRFSETALTEYATGSAMLVRRAVFEKTGLLDERFFLVWEDVDFSLRARTAGFQLGATPYAVVRHARSATFGDEASPLQRYFFVRNPFLLMRKHLRPPRRWVAELRATRRYLSWSRKRGTDPAVRRAIAKGLRHGLRGRFGPPPPDLM
jgi:hypothetical protein